MTPPETPVSVVHRNRRLVALLILLPVATIALIHSNAAFYAAGNMMLVAALLTLAVFVVPNLRYTPWLTKIVGGVFLLATAVWHADLARRSYVEPTFTVRPLSLGAIWTMAFACWAFVIWGRMTNLDVYERQVYEDRVVSLVRQLDMAQAVTGIGSYEWDVPSGQMVASSQMFVIFGIEPTDHIRREDFERRIHPDDIAQYRQIVAHALQTCSTWDMYYRIRREVDGCERVIHGRGRCIPSDADPLTVDHVIGTTQDVTERRAKDRRRRRAADVVYSETP